MPPTWTRPGSAGCAQVQVAAEEQRRARAQARAAPAPRSRVAHAPWWPVDACRLTTHEPSASRTPCAQRRSGHHVRPPPCGARRIAPRTRIALRRRRWPSARPGCGWRSPAAARRPRLREVSTHRACAPAASPARGGHHGGTSCSSATSHSQPASAAANSSSSDRPTGSGLPSVVEVPGQCPHRPPTSSPAPSWTPAGSTCSLHRAAALKAAPHSSRALEGRTVALLFNKPSTRTRTSFEAGVFELGGHPMVLRPTRCSSLAASRCATRRYILSRHAAADRPAHRRRGRAQRLAEYATVPVVNMLSPLHHPCQAIADLLTMREALGSLEGRVARLRRRRQQRRPLARRAWVRWRGCEVRVAAPDGYQLHRTRDAILTDDPAEAVAGADAVYTDVWVTMSDDEDVGRRAPRGARALRDHRRAARQGRAGRVRAALPAGPSRARRSPRPCSTATASGSGTRPRTAATRRRRCSSCSFRRGGGRVGPRPCRR